MGRSAIKLAGTLLVAVLAGSIIAAFFLFSISYVLQVFYQYPHPISSTVLLWTHTLFHMVGMIIGVKTLLPGRAQSADHRLGINLSPGIYHSLFNVDNGNPNRSLRI